MTGLPGRERSSTVSSAVWIQCTNVTDGQTDGRTDTGRQQKPPLGIASRSNNYKIRSDSNCLLHDLCNSELVSCGCSWPQRYFSNEKYVLLLFVYCFVVRKRFLSSLLNTRVTSISFVTVGFTHVDVHSARCKNICKL